MPPARNARLSSRQVLLLGTAGWLVATAVHLGIYVVRSALLGQYVNSTSPDILFLAPVGYLVFYAGLTAAALLANAVLRHRFVSFVVAAILAAVTAFAILLHSSGIYPVALVVVAVAVGTRVADLLAGDSPRWLARTGRLARGAAALVGLVVVCTLGSRAFTQWRLDSARGVADANAPDVILLILDTVRAASMSAHGYERLTTPRLTDLARGGVLFERAFSVSSWSAPSHASMLTGLWGSQTGADYRTPMRRSFPTLPRRLNDHGYRTGAFIVNGNYAGRGLRLDRGFERFEDYPVSLAQAMTATTLGRVSSAPLLISGIEQRKLFMVLNALRRPGIGIHERRPAWYSTREIVDRFWAWRDGLAPGPYFAMLNLFDAHAPYQPPAPFATLFNNGTRDRDRYDGGIAYLDSVVHSMVEGLRARATLERTVFIVTSDHGELFGEHSLNRHGNSVYLPVIHVPLIAWGPSIPPGIRVAPEVSLRDLAATILDVARIADHGLPGHSLRTVWESGTNRGASPVISEGSELPNPMDRNLTIEGGIRSAIDSSWHYILYGKGREEVFAWRSDSAQLNNLVETSEGRVAAARLRALLLRELGPPRS